MPNVVWLAASLWASEARACVCVGPDAWVISPLPGAVDVPRNTRMRVYGYLTVPGSFIVYENGLRRRDIREVVRHYGPNAMRELIPESPFLPGASVELITPGYTTPAFDFTVGDRIDDEAPQWDGEYTADSAKQNFTSCGKFRTHVFEWLGMHDEVWADETLIVELEPLDDDMESALGTGTLLQISSGMCFVDDETLEREFHRKYLAHVEDGAGNRSEPFEVDTRGPSVGCSCGVQSLPRTGRVGVWVLALLPLVLRRARRPEPRQPRQSVARRFQAPDLQLPRPACQ